LVQPIVAPSIKQPTAIPVTKQLMPTPMQQQIVCKAFNPDSIFEYGESVCLDFRVYGTVDQGQYKYILSTDRKDVGIVSLQKTWLVGTVGRLAKAGECIRVRGKIVEHPGEQSAAIVQVITVEIGSECRADTEKTCPPGQRLIETAGGYSYCAGSPQWEKPEKPEKYENPWK